MLWVASKGNVLPFPWAMMQAGPSNIELSNLQVSQQQPYQILATTFSIVERAKSQDIKSDSYFPLTFRSEPPEDLKSHPLLRLRLCSLSPKARISSLQGLLYAGSVGLISGIEILGAVFQIPAIPFDPGNHLEGLSVILYQDRFPYPRLQLTLAAKKKWHEGL
jgi:hypothetical protein